MAHIRAASGSLDSTLPSRGAREHREVAERETPGHVGRRNPRESVIDETLACPRCGSTALYPHPGLLGELSGFLGRVRHACCACRHHIWLRPFAPEPPQVEDEREIPSPSSDAPSLEALDVSSPCPPLLPDLRALDKELARYRMRQKGR